MSERAAALPAMEALPALVRDGSFEETLAALEAIVAHLEQGRLSLDETLAWYEAGSGWPNAVPSTFLRRSSG